MEDRKNNRSSGGLIDTKDIEQVFITLRKNILIVLSIPALFYLLGYIYTYRLPDEYGAKVQLLLKSNETYDYQDPIYKGLGAYGMYMDVSNQTRILQSKDLIGEVIDKMNIYVSYFVVGRIKKKEVFGTLPFKVEYELINKGLFELPIQVRINNDKEYSLIYEYNGIEKREVAEFDQMFITPDFKIKLTRSYPYNDTNLPVVTGTDYEIVFHSRDHLIRYFQQSMTITNLEYTSILEIMVQDNIGDRAKVFLDTLSSVFMDYSKRTQLEVNQNTLDNIEKQIDEVQKIILEIESALIAYKNDNDILNLSREEDDYFDKYVEFNKEKREIAVRLSSLQGLESYILTSVDEHLLPPSFYVLESDPQLTAKVNQMYTTQIELSEKVYSYSDDHPRMIQDQEKLNVMKKDLLIYLHNVREGLLMKDKEIDRLLGQYKGEIMEIPRSKQGIDNIQRELEVNNKMYLFLLEKKTNTLIARAGIIPQVQVIEKPSNLGVIGPDKGKIKRLFLMLGILVGIVVAVIRRMMFERIESVKELTKVTRLTVIGGVPEVSRKEHDILVNKFPKAQVTESFRTIRSSLAYLVESSKTKKILISSFLPSEGKTFCSANLAVILANSEKKVLILDFDLHKPKIHKVFEIPNTKGISSILTAQCEIHDALHQNIYKNLDIISAGPVPPNPSDLILRQKVNDILDWSEKNYDYVLIDTPPFGLLNDAISMIPHCQVFLVVFNTRFARKRGIHLVEEMLLKHQEISKAVILNGIRESRLKYYYSKYSYKYGYNYGYSSNYGSGYSSAYTEDNSTE